jgi:hypothetical protein
MSAAVDDVSALAALFQQLAESSTLDGSFLQLTALVPNIGSRVRIRFAARSHQFDFDMSCV